MSFQKIMYCIMCSFLLMGSVTATTQKCSDYSVFQEIYKLAGQGMIPSSAPFGVGSKIEDIMKVLGEPVGRECEMISYDKVIFGYDTIIRQDKNTVVSVMVPFSMSQPTPNEVLGMSYEVLKKELGDPQQVEVKDKEAPNSMMVAYSINEYFLRFSLIRENKDEPFKIVAYAVTDSM